MGIKCCIKTSFNTVDKNPYVSLHRFPRKDTLQYNKWLQAIPPDLITLQRNIYICCTHFCENSFPTSTPTGKNILKKDAIPLILYSGSEDARDENNIFDMEICIDSLESARNAVEGGASRLEVCSALSEGGLTPSLGLIQQIRNFATIPLYAMIRIRGGDFVYSPEEIDAMLYDLKVLKHRHVNGFVFGALTPDCEIDTIACEKIISAAHPLPVTFSRAFDLTVDPVKSMELLVELGFHRILTSGQRNTALEGLELIRTLLQKTQKIVIMPGAGITKDNIRKIMESGAKEFHASAKRRKMVVHGANRVRMGASENDFVNVTDKELVKELVKIIKNECTAS